MDTTTTNLPGRNRRGGWLLWVAGTLLVAAGVLFLAPTTSSLEIRTFLTATVIVAVLLGGLSNLLSVLAHGQSERLDAVSKLTALCGWSTGLVAAFMFALQEIPSPEENGAPTPTVTPTPNVTPASADPPSGFLVLFSLTVAALVVTAIVLAIIGSMRILRSNRAEPTQSAQRGELHQDRTLRAQERELLQAERHAREEARDLLKKERKLPAPERPSLREERELLLQEAELMKEERLLLAQEQELVKQEREVVKQQRKVKMQANRPARPRHERADGGDASR